MMLFANFSAPDLIVVFIVALVVFGPKRLPEVGQQIGKMLRDLRNMSSEFTGSLSGAQTEALELGQSLRSALTGVSVGTLLGESEHHVFADDGDVSAPLRNGVHRRGLSLAALPPEPVVLEETSK